MDEKNEFKNTIPIIEVPYYVVNFMCPFSALLPYKITFNLEKNVCKSLLILLL